jgi:fatty-acyl-CoA synthase
MQGPLQAWPLTVERIVEHASAARPQVEIFTAASLGAPARTTYAEFAQRVRRLAGALAASRVRAGDVVAVIGANSARQLEAWYAVMGLGAICHPLSPNLSPDRLASRLREGGHKVLFIEPALLGPLEPTLLNLPMLERIVALAESDEPVGSSLQNVISHDAFVAQGVAGGWPMLDENAPALAVHKAGAANQARAVSWSHRACVLQAMTALGPSGLDLSPQESILPLAPFWRAAAWGLVFAAPMAGAKLILPGRKTDIQSVRVLADREAASLIVASPSELQALHDQYRAESRRPNGLRRVIAVGAPCPPGLARVWRESFGVETSAAWGMAETAAMGAVSQPGSAGASPPFGLELQIAAPDGRSLPHDGTSIGRLRARGATLAQTWFRSGDPVVAHDGFLDTGDLASIDPQGRVRVYGRADALVAAGGNLVPAEALEAAALEHPSAAMAAAFDPPPGLMQEGPILAVWRKPGAEVGKAEFLRFLAERIGPTMGPKEILWVDGFPLDPAGRVDRATLRERLQRLSGDRPPAAPTPPPQLTLPPPPPPAAPEAAPPVQALSEPPPPELEPAAPEAEPELEPATALAASAAVAAVTYLDEDDHEAPALADEDHAPPAEAAAFLEAVQHAQHGDEPPLAEEAQEEAEAPPATEAPAVVEPLSAPEPAAMLEAEPPPPAEVPEADSLSLTPPTIDPGLAESFGPVPLRVPGPPPEYAGMYAGSEPAPKRQPRERKPSTWAGWFLWITTVLAAAPLVTLLAIAIGLRVGLIDWRTGLSDETLEWPYRLGLVGVVGGMLAIFAALLSGFRFYWRRALFSLGAPLAAIVSLVVLFGVQQQNPPLHDVATNWSDPIAFSPALLAARGPGAMPVEADPMIPPETGHFMNRRVAEVNADTCPAARAVFLPGPIEQVFDRARNALRSEGLKLVATDPSEGHLEATSTNLWLGLKSDVAVRIKPQGPSLRVDLRSSSRNTPIDFGANCDLVGRLVQRIQAGSAAG